MVNGDEKEERVRNFRDEKGEREMVKVLIMMRREREIRESQQREREVVRKERKIERDLKKCD